MKKLVVKSLMLLLLVFLHPILKAENTDTLKIFGIFADITDSQQKGR